MTNETLQGHLKKVRDSVLEEAAAILDEKASGYEEDGRDVSLSIFDRRFSCAVAVRLRGSANDIRALKGTG